MAGLGGSAAQRWAGTHAAALENIQQLERGRRQENGCCRGCACGCGGGGLYQCPYVVKFACVHAGAGQPAGARACAHAKVGETVVPMHAPRQE
eukprot:357315-Chlamydomonas_euryale.AAC.1